MNTYTAVVHRENDIYVTEYPEVGTARSVRHFPCIRSIVYRILSILFVLLLAGCGSTLMLYNPKEIPVGDAYSIIEQMIMTQHRAWKPDFFIITENYLGWDYGEIAKGRGSAVAFDNIAFGSSTSTIRNVNERVYFNSIDSIQLLDWKRKGKQWYVVSLMDNDGKVIKHIFRTRNLKDAELMMDATYSLITDK